MAAQTRLSQFPVDTRGGALAKHNPTGRAESPAAALGHVSRRTLMAPVCEAKIRCHSTRAVLTAKLPKCFSLFRLMT